MKSMHKSLNITAIHRANVGHSEKEAESTLYAGPASASLGVAGDEADLDFGDESVCCLCMERESEISLHPCGHDFFCKEVRAFLRLCLCMKSLCIAVGMTLFVQRCVLVYVGVLFVLVPMPVSVSVFVSVRMSASMCLFLDVCVCASVCICVCASTCACVCVYVYMSASASASVPVPASASVFAYASVRKSTLHPCGHDSFCTEVFARACVCVCVSEYVCACV